MTPYEMLYRALLPFEHPLYQRVNRVLRKEAGLAKARLGTVKLLDVGGRTSSYTVGVDADVCVTELPRESDVQHQRKLGATDALVTKVRNRRSNIKEYVYDDLTRTMLPPRSFHMAVAVEVIEHVLEDGLFVENLRSTLSDDGLAVITTPNGDFVENRDPDHHRHYKRAELVALLERHFRQVNVDYAVKQDRYFDLGRRRWSMRHPWRTVSSFYGNWMNSRRNPIDICNRMERSTLHLFAVVRC